MKAISCIKCTGFSKKGEDIVKFRPGTPDPGMHWAFILTNGYEHLQNVNIIYVNDLPQVHIGKGLKDEDEEAFKHFMSWIKINDMPTNVEHEQCKSCTGHESCVVHFEGDLPEVCEAP